MSSESVSQLVVESRSQADSAYLWPRLPSAVKVSGIQMIKTTFTRTRRFSKFSTLLSSAPTPNSCIECTRASACRGCSGGVLSFVPGRQLSASHPIRSGRSGGSGPLPIHGVHGVLGRHALDIGGIHALKVAGSRLGHLTVQGQGKRVQGLGCRVKGLRVSGSGFGFRVSGLGFRV